MFNASCFSDTEKEVDGFNTGDCNAKLHTKKPPTDHINDCKICACICEWQT